MQNGLIATAVTFALQSATALAWMTLPVLAPQVATSAGVDPSQVGGIAGIMFVGALVANLLAPRLVDVVGALRTIQLGAAVAAGGLLVAQIGTWPAIIASTLIIGAGYGLGVPSASQLLARHTSASHRGLVFSVKQSGVPVGGLIAGMSLPAIAVAFDWTWAVVAASAFAVTMAIAAEWARSHLGEEPRAPKAPRQEFRIRVPFVAALREHRDLPWVTYHGFAAAAVQGAIFALLVTFLVVAGGLNLVTAGFAFAVMHVCGACVRVALGLVSDRLLAPQPLLALLGCLGATIIIVLITTIGHLPEFAIFAMAAVIGATVSGWNGVYMAEVANLAPVGRVSEITANSVSLVFVGYIVGPLLASTIVAVTASYQLAFGVLAGLLLIAPITYLQRRSIRQAARGGPDG